jgi:hypothetical protein
MVAFPTVFRLIETGYFQGFIAFNEINILFFIASAI